MSLSCVRTRSRIVSVSAGAGCIGVCVLFWLWYWPGVMADWGRWGSVTFAGEWGGHLGTASDGGDMDGVVEHMKSLPGGNGVRSGRRWLGLQGPTARFCAGVPSFFCGWVPVRSMRESLSGLRLDGDLRRVYYPANFQAIRLQAQ